MNEATKKEYLRRHWILWNWLAEHSECHCKRDAFAALGWASRKNIDNPLSWCYLCQLHFVKAWRAANCSRCELGMASGNCNDDWDKPNWFRRWERAKTPKTRKKYATLIRDVVPKPQSSPEIGKGGD